MIGLEELTLVLSLISWWLMTIKSHKAMKREKIRLLRSKLFEGSKAYYEKLTGTNGRFKHLRISDIILTQPKNEWIDQHVIAEGEENEQGNVLTALPKLWEKKV